MGGCAVGDRIHWKADMLLEEHERTDRAITQYDAKNTGLTACTQHRLSRFFFFIKLRLGQKQGRKTRG